MAVRSEGALASSHNRVWPHERRGTLGATTPTGGSTAASALLQKTAIALPLGWTLALFTDGLVERRGEPLDCGLERLRSALTLEPAATCCRTAIAALIPDAGLADDAVLLIIRRHGHTGDRPAR